MRDWIVHFGVAFAAGITAGAFASLLWNLIFHDEPTVDWTTIVPVAVAIAVALSTSAWLHSREIPPSS